MERFFVYIVYSKSIDAFYIGQTKDLEQRIIIHNKGTFKGSSTKIANDWALYFSILCETRQQALLIEKHIKRMRNRTFYANLKNYPEISLRLLAKYRVSLPR
jgi:putative endonuclease